MPGMKKPMMMKKGGKATHKTKDGRTVKKGLYYYMNKRKKLELVDMVKELFLQKL